MNEFSFILSGTVTHLSRAVKHFAGTEATMPFPVKSKTRTLRSLLNLRLFWAYNNAVLHKPWDWTEGGACRVKPGGSRFIRGFLKRPGALVNGGKPWLRQTADVLFGFQSIPGRR
jgi:hypothetical protein